LPCWIAPRDVRAGEPYAAAIVEAINACRLLVLVLTKSAVDSRHVLREVERASSKNRSVLPIRLEAAELPPELEYFLSADHWLEASEAGIESVLPALIESVRGHGGPNRPAVGAAAARKSNRSSLVLGVVAVAVAVAALAYFAFDKLRPSRRTAAGIEAAAPSAPSAPGASPAFAPPPHSIAVLPFVNMSGDPKQDYFSDGLSEELLNALASVRDLQVAARTSSFSFKGTNADTAVIAHKLNVGAILEGSVRKDGAHVRITAQCINAVTGFQLWSKTYDRNLKDVLSLQTEIATAVSSALQATLLAQPTAATEPGGTDNPEAFDAYLRGEKLSHAKFDSKTSADELAAFNEAIERDPHFANAYIGKSRALHTVAGLGFGENGRRAAADSRAAAETAIAIAPNLGVAHAQLARVLGNALLDYRAAAPEFERALALSPGDARVVYASASFLALTGRTQEAIAQARKAVVLDPLNPTSHFVLAEALYYARRYRESVEAWTHSLELNPEQGLVVGYRGYAYIGLADYDTAIKSCDAASMDYSDSVCLAIAYDKLGRRAESDATINRLNKSEGDSASYQFAQIFAQRGDVSRALDWLDTAQRVGDTGLHYMKVDPLVDPLRSEPRFKAMLATIKFPD
jgi:TolB-like protein/Flp pilus assembly protein TadD